MFSLRLINCVPLSRYFMATCRFFRWYRWPSCKAPHGPIILHGQTHHENLLAAPVRCLRQHNLRLRYAQFSGKCAIFSRTLAQPSLTCSHSGRPLRLPILRFHKLPGIARVLLTHSEANTSTEKHQ